MNRRKSLFYQFILLFLLVTSSAQAQTEEPAAEAPKGPWSSNAGVNAILNTGNSDNQTVGGQLAVAWKKAKNKIELTANGAYGRSTVAGVTEEVTNNAKAQLRYDRFLAEVMSVFALYGLSFDKPAGFDGIISIAAGFLHEFLRQDPHSLRYEIGPSYNHEDRTDDTKEDIFSARGFLGYVFKFSDSAKFAEDLEALVNIEDANDVRINSLTSLIFKLTNIISFQVGFNLRADFQPVPGFEKVDTTTTVGLIFDLV